jgi:branched-chain amino acid transport system substrate-binding protein
VVNTIVRVQYALVIAMMVTIPLYSFRTVHEAQEYAHRYPEFPESNNNDLYNLDYSTFYKELRPPAWKQIARNLGIVPRALWQVKDFKELMRRVTDKHLAKHHRYPFGQFLKVEPHAQVLVWSNAHGCFHSLVRGITQWFNEKIIDNSFTLIQPHTYIVFDGNSIDYGAYSLETLTLILRLLETNPEKVIYIAGQHEYKTFWHAFGLARELEIRAASSSDEIIPLGSLVDTFFQTLPLALFISTGTDALVVISYFGSEELSFVDLLCSSNGTTPHAQVAQLCQQAKDKHQLPIKALIKGHSQLKTYKDGQGLYALESEDGATTWFVVSSAPKVYRMVYGFFYDAYVVLDLVPDLSKSLITLYYNDTQTSAQFKKGPVYNLISGALVEHSQSPRMALAPMALSGESTISYSQLLTKIDFISQALTQVMEDFTLLKKRLKDPSIEHIKPEYKPLLARDTSLIVKLKKGTDMDRQELVRVLTAVEQNFNEVVSEFEGIQSSVRRHHLVTPRAKQKYLQQQADTIILGSTMDLSKSTRGIGLPMRAGVSLRINEQNQAGGLNGKRIQMVFLNDDYVPMIARQNILNLMYDYGTRFILFPGGTPTLEASLALIKEKKMVVLFPQSGSPLFRSPDLTTVFNFRASYHDEGYTLTQYILKTYLARSLTFFYQNDSFGISILEGGRAATKGVKDLTVTEVPYSINTTIFTDAADAIKKANTDVIAFFATGPATIQLIRDLGIEFLASKTLYAVSSVGDEATLSTLKDKGLKVILGDVVPNPAHSTLEIVKQYRQEVKKAGLRESVFSLEGYIVTSITLDLMKKIKGPITMESLIKQLTSLKNYPFQGLTLTFNPKNRSIANYFWIATHEPEWLEVPLETPPIVSEEVTTKNT